MKYLFSLAFFMFANWLILDHKLNTGATWDWSTVWQPWHHEGLTALSFAVAAGLLIGKYWRGK